MRLSDLQAKEIIDITTGTRIGMIIDVLVEKDGKIKSLVLQEKRIKRFKVTDETEISWNEIVKIGDDIILIDPRNKNNWFLFRFVIQLCWVIHIEKKCYYI